MKRKIIYITLLALITIAITRTQIIDSAKLTLEALEHRNGKILIEKCVGIVTDSDKNGKVLNADSEYNYISYKYAHNVRENDIVVTYFVYNPFNNTEDDILFRFDFKQ